MISKRPPLFPLQPNRLNRSSPAISPPLPPRPPLSNAQRPSLALQKSSTTIRLTTPNFAQMSHSIGLHTSKPVPTMIPGYRIPVSAELDDLKGRLQHLCGSPTRRYVFASHTRSRLWSEGKGWEEGICVFISGLDFGGGGDVEMRWERRDRSSCGDGRRFPGSQPVSFDFHSLDLLEQEEYVLSHHPVPLPHLSAHGYQRRRTYGDPARKKNVWRSSEGGDNVPFVPVLIESVAIVSGSARNLTG